MATALGCVVGRNATTTALTKSTATQHSNNITDNNINNNNRPVLLRELSQLLRDEREDCEQQHQL